MPFNLGFALAILPTLLAAAVVTIKVALASFAVAVVGGLLFAIGRRSRVRFVRGFLTGLVEFVRSTPLLIQLYFLYFVLPDAGVTLSPFVTGVIGLGLHYSCYTAEVYRAGLDSVPKGQWEAALALNYRRYVMFTRVILPQAIPPILPPLGNYLIVMFKDTSILSAISLVELVTRANVIASEKFLYVEPMTIVGMLFLAMSLIASLVVRRLERQLAR